mmetsp:Transcript_18010/g.21158  ORF Transcript_18010/g.21158 Transcript_18010/m.21158 type:complete len:196 (-) Transcript_18010:872-1459(-)
MVRQQSGRTRGKIYMTFGKPINFEQFLTSHSHAPLKPATMDQAALQLTTHLVLEQEYISPVVLNMIVAALLLQTTSAKIKFQAFFASVREIYDFLELRGNVKMIMREPPSKRAVLDNITKLGFRIKQIEQSEGNRRGIQYKIYLDAKNDQKVTLGLAYYSNNLLQNLMMDAALSKQIVRNMVAGGQKSYAVKDMI